jgi:hypothetical protein
MLIPATWIIDLNGKRPADVSTACPGGIAPIRPSYRNGCRLARRLIAAETACGISSHHGMMFQFHALTITSTSWSSRSPSTTVTFIWRQTRLISRSGDVRSRRTTTLIRLPRECFHFKNPCSATRVQRFVRRLRFAI